jgi:hypothetical protein
VVVVVVVEDVEAVVATDVVSEAGVDVGAPLVGPLAGDPADSGRVESV